MKMGSFHLAVSWKCSLYVEVTRVTKSALKGSIKSIYQEVFHIWSTHYKNKANKIILKANKCTAY